MRMRTLIVAIVLVFAGLIGALAGLSAQQAAFTRTILQRGDVSTPGREAVMGRAEFPPGVAAGKHTHPGEEVAYVLEGTLLLEIQGKPPVTLKAGDVFFVEAGRPHDAKNTGSATAKVVSTYVVEKGKPLATPVS